MKLIEYTFFCNAYLKKKKEIKNLVLKQKIIQIKTKLAESLPLVDRITRNFVLMRGTT